MNPQQLPNRQQQSLPTLESNGNGPTTSNDGIIENTQHNNSFASSFSQMPQYQYLQDMANGPSSTQVRNTASLTSNGTVTTNNLDNPSSGNYSYPAYNAYFPQYSQPQAQQQSQAQTQLQQQVPAAANGPFFAAGPMANGMSALHDSKANMAGSNQFNQQQLSEIMYSQFLTHLAQKQGNVAMNSLPVNNDVNLSIGHNEGNAQTAPYNNNNEENIGNSSNSFGSLPQYQRFFTSPSLSDQPQAFSQQQSGQMQISMQPNELYDQQQSEKQHLQPHSYPQHYSEQYQTYPEYFNNSSEYVTATGIQPSYGQQQVRQLQQEQKQSQSQQQLHHQQGFALQSYRGSPVHQNQTQFGQFAQFTAPQQQRMNVDVNAQTNSCIEGSTKKERKHFKQKRFKVATQQKNLPGKHKFQSAFKGDFKNQEFVIISEDLSTFNNGSPKSSHLINGNSTNRFEINSFGGNRKNIIYNDTVINGPNSGPLRKLSSAQSKIERRKKLKKQGPKRPSSAYFLFSMKIREELIQQHPDARVPELSKLTSLRWKDLNEEQKRPYYDEFKINWDKYILQREEYEKSLPPKRPSGPFIQFTQEIRPSVIKEHPDKNLIEITKIIGQRWKSLSPAQRAAYTDTYKKRLKDWETCYPKEAEDLLDNPAQMKVGKK